MAKSVEIERAILLIVTGGYALLMAKRNVRPIRIELNRIGSMDGLGLNEWHGHNERSESMDRWLDGCRASCQSDADRVAAPVASDARRLRRLRPLISIAKSMSIE